MNQQGCSLRFQVSAKAMKSGIYLQKFPAEDGAEAQAKTRRRSKVLDVGCKDRTKANTAQQRYLPFADHAALQRLQCAVACGSSRLGCVLAVKVKVWSFRW